MKIINRLLYLLLICPPGQIPAQSLCNDDAIMMMKGGWKKGPDANMTQMGNQTAINNRIDMISGFFKSAYPEPRGSEAAWYRTMSGDPVIKNGPVPYNFNSLYKAWYCNKHLQKMLLGDETGTWAYVHINNLNAFFPHELLRTNDYFVYSLPEKKGEWKGYPIYETDEMNIKSNCVVLTHANQLPWKAISQEQYLKIIRAQFVDNKQKGSENYAIQEDNIRKSIASNKNNKNLKESEIESINASLQKRLEYIEKDEKENSYKMSKYWDDKISVIDNYVSRTSPATLQMPAVVDKRKAGDFNGNFSNQENHGVELVTINPAYFDNRLPGFVPQLMVLIWTWDNNSPSQDFKKQFEENFPVEKLKAMLDK